MNDASARTRHFKTAGAILALITVYFAAGKFGLSLASVNVSASPVWPPTGIALAALLVWGKRLWPAIFIGAFLVNITTPEPVPIAKALLIGKSFGIAVGNTLEAVMGAWLARRFAGGVKAFERAQNIFRFVFLAAIPSTVISATVGVTSLCLGHFAPWNAFGPIWLTWWLGDLVGDLIVAPLLVIWLTHSFHLKPKRMLEAAGALFIVVAVSYAIFLEGIRLGAANQFKYLTLLPLLWAAVRFRQHGAITCAFVVSSIALWGTLHGLGPFVTPDPNQSLLFLQAFTGTMTLTALVSAAAISERRGAEQRLQVQDAVSRVLAESPTLAEATPRIVQAFCETGGWDVGAIWNVDRAANEMFCVEVWHAPSASVPEFEAVTRQKRFASGIGLPGRIWSSGEPAWVPDVTKDSNFPRASVAIKEGLHAAFCFPIKSGRAVVGAIECFSREVREPDDHFLQMLSAIGAQLGQFIERKKAEESLRAKEAQLRLVTDITPIMLTMCSRDLRYTFVNRACAEFLGLTPDLIVGKPIPEIMGQEAYEKIRPYIDTVLRGDPVEYEVEVPYHRVGARWMRVAYMPDRDEKGNVVGWVGSISNITERKRSEEATSRSEALKGAILDSALDCIISIDQEGRIIEFNSAAEKTFGCTKAQAIGKAMAELIIPPRFREQHSRGLARYLATGEGPVLGRRIEMSALRADGTEFPVELSINAIRLGENKAFTATLRDITERKKTEAALEEARAKLKAHADELEMIVAERTQELRETIAELESFSYSISHDMRGPLRAMQGYASVLEEELKGKIGEEQWQYMERIVAASSRLGRLVQDILNYSQISRRKLQLQPVDLQAVVLEIIQQNPNFQLPLADVRVEGPLPIVLGHETALTQVWLNLLGNGVKFVYPGTTPRIRISARTENSTVRIRVADNGIGIDPKNHERIFHMFEQVNSATDFEGTGIGLAIVKKAIERMGGKIGVESELGKGTVFWFELRSVAPGQADAPYAPNHPFG